MAFPRLRRGVRKGDIRRQQGRFYLLSSVTQAWAERNCLPLFLGSGECVHMDS